MVNAGECVRIMTGAIMPAGLDTVAPQELVKVDGDTVQIPPKACCKRAITAAFWAKT